MGVAGALPHNTPVVLGNAATATLNINGVQQVIQSLNGGGIVNLGTQGTGTLYVSNGGTFNGTITGAGDIDSFGNLTLTASSSYTQGTVVSMGTLNIQNGGALGLGNVAVDAGATLQLQGGISASLNSGYVLNLYGNGTSTPSLENVSGNNSWNTEIYAQGSGAVRINSDAGSTLTLSGTLANYSSRGVVCDRRGGQHGDLRRVGR